MERLQAQMLSKVTQDEVHGMTHNLADRNWVKGQICHFVPKNELESQLKSKISEYKFENKMTEIKDFLDAKMRKNDELTIEMQNRI